MKVLDIKENKEKFDRYGKIIDCDDLKPDFASDLFSWYDAADILALKSSSVGITKAEPVEIIPVEGLERHRVTTETMFPSADVLVVLANTKDDRIDKDSIAAFRIPKGVGVTLKKGIWHSAPFADREKAVTFIVFEEKTPDQDFEMGEFNAMGIESFNLER